MSAPLTIALTVSSMTFMENRGFHPGHGRTSDVPTEQSVLPELDPADILRLAPQFMIADLASKRYYKPTAEALARASENNAKSNRSTRLKH
jgi:hypothetical protein